MPASTDFNKPDAEQAAQGSPAHERSGGSRQHDDARHGYSQDSGYQSSGGSGNEAPERKRDSTEVSEHSRTPFDVETGEQREDASKLPRE